MKTKKATRIGSPVRIATALFAVLCLLSLFPGQSMAEEDQQDLTAAAFELLEEGNPFVARYERMTGKEITPLFPYGVPYYFGGLSGSKGNGWFYMAYPDYFVKVCEHGSGYFRVGERYFYGLDCIGFTRHVYKACGKPAHPSLQDMLAQWEYRQYHLYDSRKGNEAPPYDRLKDTLQPGDLFVIKHETTRSRHIMMYIGTLRSFGYTAKEEPSLTAWLDYPLVIGDYLCVVGENGAGKSTLMRTILGLQPEDAPEHGHVQNTDYSWFTMNDGGYRLSVINLTDVKYYCWYRP